MGLGAYWSALSYRARPSLSPCPRPVFPSSLLNQKKRLRILSPPLPQLRARTLTAAGLGVRTRVPVHITSKTRTVTGCGNLRNWEWGWRQAAKKMNNLSFSELCCLFCCPPCPGKIASKLAFLPPDPTYTLMCDESGSRWTLHLSERADWQYSSREKDAIECFMTRTSRGNRIACMFVRCSPNAKYTLLFSHGNAVDLGQMSSFYIGLGSRINCNIFSYDYSGYGTSSGKPTEKNLYADIDAAWIALRTRYGIRPENVIIYGQSIGTVPSVDLAARYESAAVILHSPLTSGMRVAFPDTKKTYCFDAFPNIDKISKITSPVLIIHGTEDEVIDFSHGLALFERCQRPVEPLWVEGAGHNDVELYGQYLERLKQFVSQELVNL
ncbi:alpha/beta hydrolase domain-containing protein 17B isoform X1 [Microcaecilia unicolor]|uniref:Alpha/beta hydrolase domain-containing protein 17B n=2 Tax=Microcaecilia unicolor TaxID=1415580 RepID=A0A6P7X8R5_9AMPH|nr:alpha/beta hydrolase domain-containing protein 17B isoform X1 [Microcaecilia unicolor]